MFLVGVYQKDGRFTWDRLKESEDDHKNLQESFTELSRRYGEMSEKVVTQEKHITSVQSHSFRMSEGGGAVLFPRPILEDLSSSKETVCILNASSFCGLWFSCKNFPATSCGHTYHPWCIAELSKTSSMCGVPFVKLSLLQIGVQLQAWGFKPRFEDVQGRVHGKVELDKLQTFKMHTPCSSIAGNWILNLGPVILWTKILNSSLGIGFLCCNSIIVSELLVLHTD